MPIVKPPKGHQILRRGRVSEAGRLYFITKTTNQRINEKWEAAEQIEKGPLLQPNVPEIISSSLNWLQQQQLITLIAYCIMPDHIHLLFQLGERANLANLMQRFGSFTGLETYRKTGAGKLWAEDYYDHTLRAEEEIEKIVAYIEQNPVKAGLVEEAAQWPWSFLYQPTS